MFTEEELQSIDTKYFMMITVDPYDVTIQSRNTGHYWYLHSTGYPTEGSCIIFTSTGISIRIISTEEHGHCDRQSNLLKIMISIRSK